MPDRLISLLNAVVFSFIDVMCLAFMIRTNWYVVVVLHRPRQQVKNIHSNRPAPRLSHAYHPDLWAYLSTFIVSLPF